jgi:hypothetical protein
VCLSTVLYYSTSRRVQYYCTVILSRSLVSTLSLAHTSSTVPQKSIRKPLSRKRPYWELNWPADRASWKILPWSFKPSARVRMRACTTQASLMKMSIVLCEESKHSFSCLYYYRRWHARSVHQVVSEQIAGCRGIVEYSSRVPK